MEEVLSLDDDVLDEFYQYWKPPSESELQIPPFIWTRLKQEMSEFIMNRQRDEMTVLGLYHKQFTEVILQRYLIQKDSRLAIHRNLAEYFLGCWHKRPKLVALRIFGQQPREMVRKVREQPLQFGPRGHFNLRKLDELPHNSEDWNGR